MVFLELLKIYDCDTDYTIPDIFEEFEFGKP